MAKRLVLAVILFWIAIGIVACGRTVDVEPNVNNGNTTVSGEIMANIE